MVVESGLSTAQAASQLGLGQSTVDKYVSKFRASQPEEVTISEREELKHLRREVINLREERDILKKAAAYFAKVQA